MSTLLDQLCERCGVLPGYRDIWDGFHHTPDATRRALLASMGLPANIDAETAASLQTLVRREWARPLPPVLVVRELARPHRIAIALPLADEKRTWRWRLRRESGAEDSGECVPADLAAAGRCDLDGQTFVRRVLPLDMPVEPGYHRFILERADGHSETAEMSFIVAPAACYLPPAIQGEGRAWGFAAQLYGIRSERNWGIGDFGDLRNMIEYCAAAGAGTVLLNPLHALFPDAPEHASPYSPSSRSFFNTLYLDVEAIADFAECAAARAMVHEPPFQARLRALRAADQVDYRGVAEVKSQVLDALYAHFRSTHLDRDSERAQVFRAFQAGQGEGLRKQALFEALQEHFRGQDSAVWGWPAWPEAYRDPHAPEVESFCEAHLERVEFFEYLQWQASRQLAAAGTRSWELGLGIGVMLDLAIGVAEGGAAVWRRRELYALGASTGAPPDLINRMGQDWGLPPWIPHRLTDAAYAPFIELLRANMRDSGALRLDHVMGLQRLYWVARGLPIAEGAYVLYPFEDLLGILALESQRNRCLVVGEDLGTVPDEVRGALRPMSVLSTRLLYFERQDNGRLQPPQAYPENAAAAVTTHDLPTLAGFWQGLDIDLRAQLHLFPDDEVRNQQVVTRSEDRAQLLVALEGEGVLPPGSGMQPVAFPEMTPELAAAVYTYLARAPSKLLLLQLEDGFGVHEQPNLPGTVEPTYPNWRLKMPLNLEAWHDSAYLQAILPALRQERPVVQVPGPAGGGTAAGVRLWIPRATYRLQLNRDFDLRQATALLPYLDDLGVSHCYLSPIFKARPGSRHGYDITDHSSLNPEIASAEDFEQFVAGLKRRGMGQIMDMVPNHMGIMGADNDWWLDVLENGPASRFADYFDIDWYAIGGEVPGRVLLPVLGDHYGAVLESGELKLAFDAEEGAFSVLYYEHRFPIDPREYPRILGHELERLQARLGAEDVTLLEFQSLVTAFGHLPGRDSVAPESMAERARDKEVHKHHLAALYVGSADIAQFVDENVTAFNGTAAPGAEGFDLMHELLQAQAYRLAYWRVAADEINYRRFFDINDLAALRMDNPAVFEATHRLVRELLARGYVNGLRIDHPDGLYDPQEYFGRLQAMAAALSPKTDEENARPLYLVVEKILAAHEHLPESWPVHGTTGYDFAAACSGLFVDATAEDHFTHTYQGFIRTHPDFDERVRANKHLIMETALAGELQVLAAQLTRLAKVDRRTCDFTFNSLRGALAEIVASFPIYRTYVANCETAPDDVRYVEWAVGVAKKRSQAADPSIFDFVREVLLARHGQGGSEDYRQAVCAFAMEFQQYSSPVMAKAVEDTTFYQYNRLLALNEVGADPHRFGVSLAAFHHENQARARRWPHAMLAGSTHDSKRSEDVRARLGALSEMADEWRHALSRWSKLNRSKRRKLDTERAPSRNDEYLLYQTLLGIWPFEAVDADALAGLAQRAEAYMTKAVREAKAHSSWMNPNADYEAATGDFVRALLAPEPNNLFLRDFVPFAQRVACVGAFNSLAQVLLRLTSPGVPDLYQGSELWDFSLVDPDNRRPVDYALRQTALQAIKKAHAEDGAVACASALLDRQQDGQIKLYLTWKTLALRRECEALFRDGDYLPLKTHGARAEQLCAFSRYAVGETLIVLVPRLFGSLMGEDGRLPVGDAVWGDTWVELPPERMHAQWDNVLTGQTVGMRSLGEAHGLLLAQVFERFPYALLRANERPHSLLEEERT
ncbi:malto-oligosyltrehalose synthase [Thiobacillus denitrificans]|uniref:4-alpha-glucanotransferase n=1 Tax=Thiobacillus denitrificans TaxID=36861 RepID=A0A106BIR3_THIDE|nr:malto-oligosyltrehalose synthase [Thiobacillus denitrificans]KVW93057.1 4-alpha-glucanotransferase [Thiobacillus denitrificans]